MSIYLYSMYITMSKRQKTTIGAIPGPIAASKIEITQRAFRYFLMGLTAKETAKLMDVSERTIQRWGSENNFSAAAQPKTIQQRAIDMKVSGFSYSEIAKHLKISRSTAYNYIRKYSV